jgi:hypothetical protein
MKKLIKILIFTITLSALSGCFVADTATYTAKKVASIAIGASVGVATAIV